MPIYEYQCTACGHQMEAFQKISDERLTECPNCHKATLNKLVSAAGFQLKGTGWYVTDYSDKGKAKQAKTSDGGKEGGTESSSTETKTSDSKADDSKSSGSSSNSTAEKQ